MLVHLYIDNFILIEEMKIDLSNQFNAFTGETGAGKSLFVDALNFVSGQRSSASVVGKHKNSAFVEAVFSFQKDHLIFNYLNDLGLSDTDDDLVIFSREMTKDGRSSAKINHRMVNLSTTREALALALDIHSQHETQYLLNEKNHLNLIDQYLNNPELIQNFEDSYRKYHQKNEELEKFKEQQFNPEEIEFSKFLLKEIENLKPSLQDFNEVSNQLKTMENFEKHKLQYQTVEETLTQTPDVVGVLYNLMDEFEKIGHFQNEIKDIYFQLEDIAEQIKDLNRSLTFDEYEFEVLNQRMAGYNQMIRKYGSIEALLEKKEELEIRINNVDHFNDILEDLENDTKQLHDEAYKCAKALSKARQTAAKDLEVRIVKELEDLLLENTKFEIKFNEIPLSKKGVDNVQFNISMNKGQAPAPLSKVASGGELSRVMLGLKVVFSKVQGITTLIFDEIDTGVSGRVAFKIGEKMKQISKDAQVICVTHLPTVAACAQHHYLIAKQQDEITTTSITLMNRNERIEHMALMMAGDSNAESIKAAEKLLNEGEHV